MLNTIIWIIIIISLVILIIIFLRHFPQLAILDVANMPTEKANQMKEQMIKNRLIRDWSQVASRLETGFFKWWQKIRGLFLWLDKLKTIRAKHLENQRLATISQAEKIKLYLAEAEILAKSAETADLERAEQKLIEVVSLDKKSLSAFRDLGEIYARLKKYSEARQTWRYALRLLELQNDPSQEAAINYFLSEINVKTNLLDEARDNIIESLKIEPNNPRYLDALLEISLKLKDRALAEATLERLIAVNPDNQKLGEWRDRIDNL